MFLIDDLLLAPFKLGIKVLEKIRDEADEQMLRTEDSVRKKYMEIQMLYENGELEEKEYNEWVRFLEKRLEDIKEYEKGKEHENKRGD